MCIRFEDTGLEEWGGAPPAAGLGYSTKRNTGGSKRKGRL